MMELLTSSRIASPAGNEAARVRLAARSTTPPAVLRRLAHDPAVTVRAAVAMNPAYAPDATEHLLQDRDDRVRALLADKVARLLPGLTGKEHRDAYEHVHNTLLSLAQDAAIRVRLAIVEVLQTMPEAPRAVILKLANDPVNVVSEPVMRLSPLLTNIDLLELLASPPHAGTAEAVANRCSLEHEVCHSIAMRADNAAIVALLRNTSATIQEATLDALIGRAGDQPDWHEPLVRRPGLMERAARALSTIVSGHLLQVLRDRPDLSSDLAAEIGTLVAAKLSSTAELNDEELIWNFQQLKDRKELDEAVLVRAASSGNSREVRAILAAASGVTTGMLDRAVALRSAKSLISVTWRAGFSAHAAQLVQSVLGQLSPDETLPPTPFGDFPLSDDEMDWQIELLNEPCN